MFRNLVLLGLLGATACGVGALPELPTAATEDTPNKVEILGVWPAQGEEQITPAVLVVGRAYKLKVRVSGLGDVLLPSEPLVASIESESFERVISFPRGNTCITPAEPASADDEGVCTIVFYAEGLVRDVGIMVRAQRALAVTEYIDLELRADLASARLRFVVPGVGTATWLPGDADPLPALQAMGLSLEEDQAAPLVIELKDAYDNPLVGQRVELADWLEPQAPVQPDPDGGVSTDALISEAGAFDARIADALLMDSGHRDAAADDTPDTGTTSDALSQDAPSRDLPDASLRSDVGGLDGGRDWVSGTLAGGRVAVFRHDGVRCSSEVDNEARHEVLSDALGRATFCLKAGETLGAWQMVIKLAELIDPQTIAARSQDGFVLKGRTRAGDPDRLILLGHDNEVDEPLSRCEAGDVTPLEYFQVLSVGGRPVAGAEVDVWIDGAARLLSSGNPVSDDQGRIAVQVSCPITMPNRSTIHARLLGASVDETRKQALLYVRLEVQRIERLRLMVDQPGQALLSLGRGQALEPIYFRVLAEGSRGTPAVDSRLNLQLLTSQDNNDLLFLSNERCDVQPERSVHNQSVYTDADGVFRFAVCGVGLSTVLRPMVLVVRAHGQVTQLQVPITLLAGDPVRVVADPPGRVTTMVGGAAGALDVVVQDEAGNGVPGAVVQVVRPPSIELTGCSHQCTTLEGVTNAIGRYSAWISRVTSEGEHDLTLRAAKGVWSGVTAKTVVAGVGAATQLGLYREGRLLVPVLGAPQVDVPVGGAVEQPLTLRLENRVGGGVIGEGIAVTLIEGAPNQCGRIGLEGRVTNEAGEIVFGGDQGVALEAGPALGDCMWRFSAGVDLQATLRVHQVAGAPYGGSPEVDEGIILTSLQAPPNDWNQAAPIATDVRVRAVDRFGNPKLGLRMWLGATNCWIQNQVQQLDENGEGTWRVAGGRDYSSPCTLHMRYAGGDWQAAQPLVIPVSGLPVPVIESLDRLERETTATWRQCPVPSTYYSGNACYYRGAHLKMSSSPAEQHHVVIRIDDTLVIRPDALSAQLNASCYEEQLNDPYANCSRVQLVDVTTAGDELIYTPIAQLPIRWRVVLPDSNANRALEFHVKVPQTLLSDGRDKALRIVQPDGRTIGPPHRFHVQPPVRWVRQSTRVLSPDNPNEQARLWGGHRLQLDGDEAQEAVFCGNDDRGGILAVLNRENRNDPYPETIEGIRLWSMPTGPKMPVASRASLACALGDLDRDGRDDLVIPLPTSENNRIPRLMLLRGVPQAPFFDVDNSVTIFLNSAPAYPAHPPSQVAVSDQPNRIWVCFGGLDEGDSPDGACTNDAALSLFVQSNPFVGNPNLAIGAQTTHATSGNNWPVIRHFQVADQVYFEGLGTVTAHGMLLAKSKPWPEQPLTLDGTTHVASHFDEASRVITTLSESGNVRRWDHHGALLAEFSTPQQAAHAVFAPSGDRAATVDGADVYVWRTSDGAILYTVSGTAAYWTATNSEAPDSVLVVSQTVGRNINQEQNVDVRTYTANGVLIREFPAAFYWRPNPHNRGYTVAASPGAEHLYVHQEYATELRAYVGQTGQALDDLVSDLSLRTPEFNHDVSRVLLRGYRLHQRPRNQWVALPSGQVLYEDCTDHDDDDCDAALFSQAAPLIFPPDNRFFISSRYGWIRNVDRPLEWRGFAWDPTQGSIGSEHYPLNASTHSGYLLKALRSHNWAGSFGSVYVVPVDQTPGGVTPVVYSDREDISGRHVHPEPYEFRFSTFLVPQAEDHGDLMLLTRRGYRHGLTNHFYNDNNYGLQWGRADAYTVWNGPFTISLGDGEIVVARPETWRPDCGNGSLDPGELLDPGQPWHDRWDCGASLVARCGDGQVDEGEDCDDGNLVNNDECVGCLVRHPGWRQDEPVSRCRDLADDAVDGTYWVGDVDEASPTYCARINDAWWTLAARFTNDDGLQWRGTNWTSLDHQFGDCGSLQEHAASDCRSEAWDLVRTTELLAVERLERNGQVYQGRRVYRLDQPRRMSEIANLPANTNIFDSTQLVSGGDNLLALAPADDPPHLWVNYDLGNDGCRLATSTNSGRCTSGLACRQYNSNYWCHGDVNTDGRDGLEYQHHGEQPAWLNHTVHLFVREVGN